MRQSTIANALLILSLLIPTTVLCLQQQADLLWMPALIALVLVFFTVLIRGMLRRGVPSAPELYGRTLTFWWMLAGFLVAVATPKVFSFLLMAALCALAWREHLALLPRWRAFGEARIGLATELSAYGAIAGSAAFAYFGAIGGFLALTPVVAAGLLPVIFTLENQTRDTVAVLGYLALGLLFFGFGLGHGLLILNLGAVTLLYAFVLTEGRDLISYWIGKALAKLGARNPRSRMLQLLNAKIAPAVSPNKAWGAGLISILLTAGLAAALTSILPEFAYGRVSAAYSALIGLVVGVLGLFGDLVFSMVKRDLGVKDSGHGLPGGTGVIDRIDSLVLTLPAVFHLIFWKFF